MASILFCGLLAVFSGFCGLLAVFCSADMNYPARATQNFEKPQRFEGKPKRAQCIHLTIGLVVQLAAVGLFIYACAWGPVALAMPLETATCLLSNLAWQVITERRRFDASCFVGTLVFACGACCLGDAGLEDTIHAEASNATAQDLLKTMPAIVWMVFVALLLVMSVSVMLFSRTHSYRTMGYSLFVAIWTAVGAAIGKFLTFTTGLLLGIFSAGYAICGVGSLAFGAAAERDCDLVLFTASNECFKLVITAFTGRFIWGDTPRLWLAYVMAYMLMCLGAYIVGSATVTEVRFISEETLQKVKEAVQIRRVKSPGFIKVKREETSKGPEGGVLLTDPLLDDEEDQHVDPTTHYLLHAFGCASTVVPSRYVRNYGLHFSFMIGVHCVATCSLICRAVHIVTHTGLDMHQLEMREILAIALLYFVVGVVMPVRANALMKNVPFLQLLGVQQFYELKHESGQDCMVRPSYNVHSSSMYLYISNIVWPVFFAIGILAPILVWIPVIVGNRLETSIVGPAYLPVYVLTSTVSWSMGMMLFGSAKVEEICLGVASDVIDYFIEDIKKGTGGWEIIETRLMALDRALADVFALRAIGGLWGSRVLVFFTMGLVLNGASIVHKQQALRDACMLASVLCAASGTTLLWRLGGITEKCTSTRPGGNSIFAAVYSSSLSANLFGELQLETVMVISSLKTYLGTRRMGISIAGMHITQSFVLTTGLRLCVYLPVATAIVGKALHGS